MDLPMRTSSPTWERNMDARGNQCGGEILSVRRTATRPSGRGIGRNARQFRRRAKHRTVDQRLLIYATGASLRTDGQQHAFLAFNGQMVDVGTLGGAWSAGSPSINNAGDIAGSSQTAFGYTRSVCSGPKWRNARSRDHRWPGKAAGRQSTPPALSPARLRQVPDTFHATLWNNLLSQRQQISGTLGRKEQQLRIRIE